MDDSENPISHRKKEILSRIVRHQFFDIFIFIVVIFMKMWILGDFVLYGRQDFALLISAKILTVTSLFLIGLTAFYMSRRRRIIYFLAWDIFFSIFLFLCIVYYRQFGDFPSLTMLSLLSQLGDVKNSVTSLFTYKDFWLFIDPVIALVVFICLRKKISLRKQFYPINQMFSFVIVFFLIVGVCGIATMELSGDYEKRNASRLVAVKVGFINYLALDTATYLKSKIMKVHISDDRVREITETLEKNQPDIEDGDYYGVFKGKNALFVQLESFSGYLVNRKIGDQEITPNLNRLISTSYYADNFYSEIGGGHSSDAEFTALTSLYPLDQESSFVMHGNNNYLALPSFFKNEGYYTVSAHAHRGDFWNRKVMHASLGFEDSWFRDSYEQDDLVGIGITDQSFMRQTVDKLSKVNKPFFGYLITLESHTPFLIPKDLKEMNLGELEGTKVGEYLQSVHHADKAIGELIEGLKEKGLYDDTVIIMYGDHDAELDTTELNKWFPVTKDEQIFQKKVPFIIHDPSGQLQGKTESIMGHLDIAPTALHLWGIEPEKAYFFGSNIFASELRHFVRISQNHIVTDQFAMLNMDNTAEGLEILDSKSRKKIPLNQDMKNLFEQTISSYKMSNDIIEGNLITRMEGVQEQK